MDSHPVSMAVRRELENMLAEAGRGSATRLAHALGVMPQTVSKWRTGQVALPVERWIAVPLALGVADPLRLVRAAATVEPELEHQLTALEQAGPADDINEIWTVNIRFPGRLRNRERLVSEITRDVADDLAAAMIEVVRTQDPAVPESLREVLERATPEQLARIEVAARREVDGATRVVRRRTIPEADHRELGGGG